MLTIRQMQRIKEQIGYNYQQIAGETGIPLSTVQKVLGGFTKVPRKQTLECLDAFFRSKLEPWQTLDRVLSYEVHESAAEDMMLRDPISFGSTVRKKQLLQNTEDYYRVSQLKRVELIDGQMYDMAAPGYQHQAVLAEVNWQIQSYIRKNKGKCQVLESPVDVRLDQDEWTMVQPDLMILSDESKLRKWGVDGAPDFVLEVTSDSTKNQDYKRKLYKYGVAGVREYWILDMEAQVVIVHHWEKTEIPEIHNLGEEIPLGIYHGQMVLQTKPLIDIIKKELQE